MASPPLLAPNLKSNKIRPRKRTVIWGHSSVGRAPALQAGGREFDSHCFHQIVPCWLCWRLRGSAHYLTAIPAKNLSAADEVLRTHGLLIVPCWLCWRLRGSAHYLTAIPAKNLSAADEVLRTHGLFRSIAQ